MSINPGNNTSAEWDRLWQVVRDSPDDFTSWEQLIRVAEGAEGGITNTSPAENMTRLESVYDSFLAKFPLCFGYWKKYADWELAVHGDEGAEKVNF
jgi:pre-mRNA-processing factor 39